MSISPIQDIIADIRAGRMVILVDEEDRENEGDLVLAAEHVTPEAINFMVKHARGLVCLTLTESRCRQLNLPPMVQDNRTPHGTAFTVSIEAAEGVTTGISAFDRSRTVKAAVARDAKPDDLVQPGHIFPLTAQNGGVLVRAGHTEAGCDLSRLAGLEPAAVICEILKDDGTMARLPDLLEFAAEHNLKIGTIRDLIHYRSAHEKLVECVAERQIETAHGAFRVRAYLDKTSGEHHLALIRGTLATDGEVLVRVHQPESVLDFIDLDAHHHAFSLDGALRVIAERGSGVVILLQRRDFGQDLAQTLQPQAAAQRGPAPWDTRLYGIGAQILRDIGIRQMRLLATPRRIPSMAGFGLEVTGYLAPEDAHGTA